MTSPTFHQLGIPFELFDAPVEAARDYAGIARCSICQATGSHCFRLGVGASLILSCPQCATTLAANRWEAGRSRWSGVCHACNATLDIPTIGSEQLSCYGCLRSLRVAMTKDTELGMIGYREAVQGVTLGVPGLARTDFELVPRDDSEWIGARVPQELMMELLRTPNYRTLQGDKWLFCCARPMTFVGQWSRKDYSANAPDGDGQGLFERITRGKLQGQLQDVLDAGVGVYVFRCRTCKEYSAHWDFY